MDVSLLVLQTLQGMIDEKIEQWEGAFDGPPEAQMEALEMLADVREGFAKLIQREEREERKNT